jgi:hypothetical protein
MLVLASQIAILISIFSSLLLKFARISLRAGLSVFRTPNYIIQIIFKPPSYSMFSLLFGPNDETIVVFYNLTII